MKLLKFTSLKKELIFRTLISVMTPMLAAYVAVFYIALNNAEKNMETIYENNLRAAKEVVETALHTMQDVSLYMSVEPNVIRYMEASPEDEDYDVTIQNIRDILSMFSTSSSYYQSITLLTNDGRSMQSGARLSAISPERMDKAARAKGYYVWHADGERENCIYMCRQLRVPQNLKLTRGYMQVAISLETLGSALPIPVNQPALSYFLIDESGHVFFSSRSATIREKGYVKSLMKQEELRSFFFDRENGQIVSACDINMSGWKLITVAPYSYLSDSIHSIRTLIFVTLFACIALYIWTTIISIRSFVKPLNHLASLMKSVGEEQFGVHLEMPIHTELRPLIAQFNEMSARLKTLYHQNYLNQLEIVRSELHMLESQMNPHFLYNTLDTIYWAVKGNQTEQACVMCTSLSNLLHMTLSRESGGMITLSQELNMLNHYLAIQRIRYGDSLLFSLNVEPGLEKLTVCKLILQPMVENAIVHGIDQTGYGEISVTIRTEGDLLIYEISDSCATADEKAIERALRGDSFAHTSHGLALFNINRRIKLVYGQEYGVAFKRMAYASQFTITMLQSPVREEKGVSTCIN